MPVVTAGEMKAIDRRAIEEYKIPGIILMEHAAQAVAGRSGRGLTRYGRLFLPAPATTVATGGGRPPALDGRLGSDGFPSGPETDLPPDAAAIKEMAIRLGIPDRHGLRFGRTPGFLRNMD